MTDRDRLLLDVMLGRLATYLRMCGYDVEYALDTGEGDRTNEVDLEDDETILEYVAESDRLLLTRDRELASRCEASVLLTEREISDQLEELSAAGFDLTLPETPVRCGVCNGSLSAMSTEPDLPEYVPWERLDEVWRCEDCGQFFWKGSHWDDVRTRLDGI